MKVLKKKLKKTSKVQKLFYFLTIIGYLLSLTYFIYGLLHLKGIETALRIIAIIFFSLWFAVYALGGLISILAKKKKTFIVLTIFTLIFCPIFVVSSYYINKVYGALNSMNRNTIEYTTNLIALKETNFKDDSIIGMVEAEDDTEGNILAKKLISKQNLSNKIETYEDYHSMLEDMYNGKIDACFVSSNFAILFGNEDNFPDIVNEVKVLYEFSEEMENKDIEVLQTDKTKNLTEPFTMLIMGVDSEINGLKANQAFNGDTLILVTFNPNTLSATMFSIPRDTYVPIACNHNRYAKINSSAAYGSNCVMSTIQQLTGIEIDYYVKMNFQGVVDLVDALGGVTVDVEEPDFDYDSAHAGQVCEQNSKRQFGSNLICMNTGIQTLNGEQALAYARCRHLYAISDIARNQHQQAIIEAMAQKLKTISSVKDFENILTAVSNNVETNMTTEQILSIYNVGKEMLANTSTESNALSIKKTYLAYYSLPVYLPASGRYTSALGYYPESLEAIVKAMKINLGLEEETPTKTFEISYNEDYTTPLIGQGLTGGEKLERMPNYEGYDQTYVSNWCLNTGISCSFESTSSSAEYGSIVNQSEHEGVLLNSISSITFYYSDGLGSNISYTDDDEDEEMEENDEETNNSNSSSSSNNNSSNNSSNSSSSSNSSNSSSSNSNSSNSSNENNKNEDSTSPSIPDDDSSSSIESIPGLDLDSSSSESQ